MTPAKYANDGHMTPCKAQQATWALLLALVSLGLFAVGALTSRVDRVEAGALDRTKTIAAMAQDISWIRSALEKSGK